MIKSLTRIASAAAIISAVILITSCSERRSYSELLTDESKAVNLFLSDQRVEGSIPVDSMFEVGPEAPYYQLDDEGNVYMQVLDKGDMNIRPETDDRVYFRFLRYNLSRYESGSDMPGVGNAEDVAGENGLGSMFFLFNNYTLSSSSQYGSGLQEPMKYLGANAHVNLVVKSQFGLTNETANVIPFLYDIRYYSSPLSPWASETRQD